jgi:hypothetical protein
MATPAGRWLDAWFRAWTQHDPDALTPVYAEGAVQRSAPFRERETPQRYAAWAFAYEEAAEVWFAEPSVVGEEAAACEWWAVSRDREGRSVTLAGVSLLRFGADGRVVRQDDYWSQRDGAHEPAADWGPAALHGRGPG